MAHKHEPDHSGVTRQWLPQSCLQLPPNLNLPCVCPDVGIPDILDMVKLQLEDGELLGTGEAWLSLGSDLSHLFNNWTQWEDEVEVGWQEPSVFRVRSPTSLHLEDGELLGTGVKLPQRSHQRQLPPLPPVVAYVPGPALGVLGVEKSPSPGFHCLGMGSASCSF